MSDRPLHGSGAPSTELLPSSIGSCGLLPAEPIDPLVWSRMDAYLARHPGGAERLIPLLHLVQATLGYLPVAVQEQVATRLGLPLVQIHGVVSFYHFFNTTPRAKYQLKVCMGTACFVRRARALTEAIQQVLGVDLGSVTKDGLFGLDEVHCLGSCGMAPVLTLNDDTHGYLTPGDARKLVFGLQARARRERVPEPSEGVDE